MKAAGDSHRPNSVVDSFRAPALGWPVILPGLLPTDPDANLDLHWAARALELALRADYRTSPNPMVGAVVLDSTGNLAGEGYHRKAGELHAEQAALDMAGDQAQGGTLYVNLEP